MADYFPGRICIGGKLPKEKLVDLVKVLMADNPSGPNYGDDFDVSTYFGGIDLDANPNLDNLKNLLLTHFTENGFLCFSDTQARYGEFDSIEPFCRENSLSFDRESDHHDEFDGEEIQFRPDKDPKMKRNIIDSKGNILYRKQDVERIQYELSRNGILKAREYLNELLGGGYALPRFEIV